MPGLVVLGETLLRQLTVVAGEGLQLIHRLATRRCFYFQAQSTVPMGLDQMHRCFCSLSSPKSSLVFGLHNTFTPKG
jgi:hypothetical protein